MVRQSGDSDGKRKARGGRATVRRALYMAALVGTQSNSVIRDFYLRLLQKGKPKKLALVACMPLQSCVPAELCCVSLSRVHSKAALVAKQTIDLPAPCLKKSRGFGGRAPKQTIGGRNFMFFHLTYN